MLTLQEKRQQTARAAESLVKSELSRRGYRVAFLGTYHPIADFKVLAPTSGREFLVDEKGNSAPNSWAYPDKPETNELYYILVELWTVPPSFYILTQTESIQLGHKYQDDHPKNKNRHHGGFGRTYPYPFKDLLGKAATIAASRGCAIVVGAFNILCSAARRQFQICRIVYIMRTSRLGHFNGLPDRFVNEARGGLYSASIRPPTGLA